jgi:phage repressor protein C with HTH and peptisase S24 domain
MDKLEKIADYFDVPIDYFFEKESDTNVSRFIYEVAAGNGRINDGCYTEESADTIRDYSYVRICGDSMYPSLHDGDVVKVHHVTDDITPSDFAIVKVNGDESTCKHIEITKDGIWLRAENKEVFEDTFYSVQEVLTLPITIIGKAIAIIERKL